MYRDRSLWIIACRGACLAGLLLGSMVTVAVVAYLLVVYGGAFGR